MAEKSYLDSVGDYLKTLNDQGLAVRFGVVFGSWAKGNPGQWSDIDLMWKLPAGKGNGLIFPLNSENPRFGVARL